MPESELQSRQGAEGKIEGNSLLAGESVGVGGFLEGAGPWAAEAVNVTEGGAVLQSTAGSCVAACGEMLSGGAMSQAEFLAQLGEWSNPGALAEALNALEGVTTWEGGYFASAADAVVAAQEGQMGAVPAGPIPSCAYGHSGAWRSWHVLGPRPSHRRDV